MKWKVTEEKVCEEKEKKRGLKQRLMSKFNITTVVEELVSLIIYIYTYMDCKWIQMDSLSLLLSYPTISNRLMGCVLE